MKITDVRVEHYRWPKAKPIANGKHTYTHNELNLLIAVARAQELETENETLDADILQAQGELDAAKAQEDNAYYLTVYEAYSQGMKKVEGYIEGN